MPKEIKWYGCEYCDYKSVDWDDVREHETDCSENPDCEYCGACKDRIHTAIGDDKCRRYERNIYCCGINHWNACKCKQCLEDQRKNIK